MAKMVPTVREARSESILHGLVTLVMRAGLVLALLSAGWLVYIRLPHHSTSSTESASRETTLQIVLRPSAEMNGLSLEIPIELYPVDIVAVRHEYFTERPAGKRFDDFLNERMNGRTPLSARLDKFGQVSLVVSQGNWWIHAVFSGDEDLEWRLPISAGGQKMTVELTPRNAYTRTKTF